MDLDLKMPKFDDKMIKILGLENSKMEDDYESDQDDSSSNSDYMID